MRFCLAIGGRVLGAYSWENYQWNAREVEGGGSPWLRKCDELVRVDFLAAVNIRNRI